MISNFKEHILIPMFLLLSVLPSCVTSSDEVAFLLKNEITISKLDTKTIDIKTDAEINKNKPTLPALQDLRVNLNIESFTFESSPIPELVLDQPNLPLILNFSVAPSKLPEKTFYRLWQPQLTYEAEFSAKLGGYLPITHKMTRASYGRSSFILNISKESDQSLLSKLKFDHLHITPRGIDSQITFHCSNPFSFSLNISDLRLDIRMGKIKLGVLQLKETAEIPAFSEYIFKLKHQFHWRSALEASPQLPEEDLQLSGVISIKTASGLSKIHIRGSYPFKEAVLSNHQVPKVSIQTRAENPDEPLLLPSKGAFITNTELQDKVEYEVASQEPRLQDHSECNPPSLLAHIPQRFAAEFEADLGEEYGFSAEEENKIGQAALSAVVKKLKGKLDTTSTMAKMLQEIGLKLSQHSQRADIKYQFYLLQDVDMINAFALPGGHVMITAPMLKKVIINEAQIASVLGHEIAHIELRHSTAIVAAIQHVIGVGDEFALITHLVSSILDSPYSAAKEEAADLWGLKASYMTGYSALSASDMWTHWKEISSDKKKRKRLQKKKKTESTLMGHVLSQGADLLGRELEAVLTSHPKMDYRACLARKYAALFAQKHPRSHNILGRKSVHKVLSDFKVGRE